MTTTMPYNNDTYNTDYKIIDKLIQDTREVNRNIYKHIRVTIDEIVALARITKSRTLPVYRYKKSSSHLVADMPIYYLEAVYMWCNLGRPMQFEEFYFNLRGAHAPPGDNSLPSSLLNNYIF